MERGGKESKVEEVFKKGGEIGVDEIDARGNGGSQIGDTVCHGSGLVKGILLTKRVGP